MHKKTAPERAVMFILVLMETCGITLSMAEFSLVICFYFSIYIKFLKRGEKTTEKHI